MPDLYWHRMGANCSKCESSLTLTAVLYSADGQIKLEWACIKCAKESYTIQSLVECITLAFQADLEQSFFVDKEQVNGMHPE